MKKKADWPERLNAFIASRTATPFVWGEQDCCLFACDAVLEMTEVDLARGIRGRYHTKVGAVRVIRAMGGTLETLAEQVTREFGLVEVRPAAVQRGGILLADTPQGLAVGICVGSRGAFAGPTGLTFIPLSGCRRGWLV